MLVILPPSESKRDAPDHGRPVAIRELSFPDLNALRERILDALIAASHQPDALERLHVKPTLGVQVARNTALRELPTLPAWQVYTGALHAGLDYASLSVAAKERARTSLVITSSLWGLLRPTERIPPYRLLVWAELEGIGRVDHAWRTVVPAVLSEAAGQRDPVVDLRSPPYQSIGKPAGLGHRTLTIRVLPEIGERTIGDVIAKRIRGRVARTLLEATPCPSGVDEVVQVLAQVWPVRLDPPTTRGGSWTIRIRPTD